MHALRATNATAVSEYGTILHLEYSVFATEIRLSSDFQGESYGVRIECPETERRAEIADITTSIDRINELIQLLSRNQVTPVTLYDVVQDWL